MLAVATGGRYRICEKLLRVFDPFWAHEHLKHVWHTKPMIIARYPFSRSSKNRADAALVLESSSRLDSYRAT